MGFEELQQLAGLISDQPGQFGPAWDVFVYILIVLDILLLFLLFQGSMRDVILMAMAMLAAIADKFYMFGFLDPGAPDLTGLPDALAIDFAVYHHTVESVFTWVARLMMFFAPTLIVTQTKISKAKPVAALLSLLTFVYVFGRWFFQIRIAAQNDNRPIMGEAGSLEFEMYMASSGAMLLVLSEGWLRQGYRWLQQRRRDSH